MTSPPTPPRRTGPDSQWSTLAVHAGEDQEAKPRGAVADPIFCASTYAFSDTQALLDFIVQKQPREEYARYGNPTEKTVERKLAVLEGAEAAVLYATGMAAVSGLLLAKLSAGDELVMFDELYQRTREFCVERAQPLRHRHPHRADRRFRAVGSGHYAGHAAACSANRPPTRI